MKTEVKEVKRRGKYNKDKAGNLGKLGRKAMKEVKVEQVTVVILRMYIVHIYGDVDCVDGVKLFVLTRDLQKADKISQFVESFNWQ